MAQIKLHDTVALIEDTKTQQFMTEQEIILRRRQVGTVVEEYKNGEAFEVEFSDNRGQIYALLTVKSNKKERDALKSVSRRVIMVSESYFCASNR